MAVDIREVLDPWQGHAGLHGSTESEAAASEMPISRVVERVNDILGYDIFAADTLAAGYREYAAESLAIAEANTAAAVEALPEA